MAKLEKGINDLATLMPDIAQEWDVDANEGLMPSDVTLGSNKEVWWLCPFGHEYPVVIYVRQRTGCPICDSEKRTSFSE